MSASATHLWDFVLLHQAVEHHAEYEGDHPAIDDGERSLRYGQLRSHMDRLAGVLIEHGLCRHGRVGIYLENGIPAVIAMLGTLRAGGCYVPIPPAFPPERGAMIAVDAELHAMVTTQEYLPRLVELIPYLKLTNRIVLIVLDDTGPSEHDNDPYAVLTRSFAAVVGQDALACAGSPPTVPCVEEDLAYILYTSGTTGKPKGVMLSHKNVMSFLRWAVPFFKLTPGDRLSNHSNIGFDLSVFDIFGALLAGGTVCPIVAAGDRAYPARFIVNRRVTVWFSVPTVLGTMRAAKQLSRDMPFPDLRLAICCGETLPAEYAKDWMTAHPHVPLVNLYGPTEAAIACTYHRLGTDASFDPDHPVPIGRPCRDTEILVLRQDNDGLAATNEIGRLFICGSQVCPGYWRQPQLTQKAFRINPHKKEFAARMYDSGDLAYRDAHGVIYFVGRADSQVKYLGYRIELGDIEAALGRCSLVQEAAVVLLEGQMPMLAGAVVTAGSIDEAESRIVDHCASILPPYMIPERIVIFAALPRNPNGKIDRGAIKKQIASTFETTTSGNA
jgi:amino acid adenylation domain-containing protein